VTYINGGLTQLDSVETAGVSGPLGKDTAAGAIQLQGGGLQFTSVDHYDYSPRITLADNFVSTIDTNGQNVTFANALGVGTNASGGLQVQDSSASHNGSLTLSANNTYGGPTSVNSGTLIVTGSLSGTAWGGVNSAATLEVDGSANTAATISSTNGTLQGVGTVGAVVLTSTANLAPGVATTGAVAGGALAAGNVTFSDTASTLSITMGVSASGTDSTSLVSSGAVTLDNTPLKLTLASNFANAAGNTVFLILNGGVTGYGTGGEFLDYNGAQIAANTTFTGPGGNMFELLAGTVNGDANSVGLETLTAVPEPATCASLIGGIAMLVAVQRARRRALRVL
jgi:autotransporter-associated beta strand protein